MLGWAFKHFLGCFFLLLFLISLHVVYLIHPHSFTLSYLCLLLSLLSPILPSPPSLVFCRCSLPVFHLSVTVVLQPHLLSLFVHLSGHLFTNLLVSEHDSLTWTVSRYLTFSSYFICRFSNLCPARCGAGGQERGEQRSGCLQRWSSPLSPASP